MLLTASVGTKCCLPSRNSSQIYFLMHTPPTHPHEIISAEGVQQGDPVGPLFFCLTIHRLISKLKAEFVVFYLDDGTIGGCLDDVSNDLKLIEEEGKDLGLQLNMNKSELINQCEDSLRTTLSTFPGLHFVPVNNATLLESPLGDTDSINQCLESKICQLKLISKRLCYFGITRCHYPPAALLFHP